MKILILQRNQALLFSLFIISLVGILWLTENSSSHSLVYDVPQISLIQALESPYLYYFVHIFTFLPVFLLSFDKKVRFYKTWKNLFPSILFIALLFIAWDIYFTKNNVWDFNPDYYIGPIFFDLPLEEILFFINVPFACLFIYECLNKYVEKDILKSYDRIISIAFIIAFLGIGLFSWGKMYTSTTFILTGGFVLWHYLNVENTYRTRFYLAYLVSWIPFLLVDGVLTGGYTNAPVVLYNPSEFLGIRIGSVPLEDAIYSLLLLMSITTVFEYSRSRQNQKKL